MSLSDSGRTMIYYYFESGGENSAAFNFAKMEEKMMRYKVDELHYERVRIFGKTGFFTNERIQRDSVPEGFYQYEVRHDDCCQGIPCEVAKGILVNFWGTLLMTEELLKWRNMGAFILWMTSGKMESEATVWMSFYEKKNRNKF